MHARLGYLARAGVMIIGVCLLWSCDGYYSPDYVPTPDPNPQSPPRRDEAVAGPGGSGGPADGSPYCEPVGVPADATLRQMAEALNGYRLRRGLNRLYYSRALEEAAMTHAADLYHRGFFDHVNPDGKGPYDRAREAGFCNPQTVGENIARGHESVYDVQLAWQNSPGHDANMLHPAFTYVGMGHFQAPNGTHYWVQVLGRTRE